MKWKLLSPEGETSGDTGASGDSLHNQFACPQHSHVMQRWARSAFDSTERQKRLGSSQLPRPAGKTRLLKCLRSAELKGDNTTILTGSIPPATGKVWKGRGDLNHRISKRCSDVSDSALYSVVVSTRTR